MMAKKKNKIEGFIDQDGWSWNVELFQKHSENEVIEMFVPKGYKRSTITAVWKQSNGKSEPNEVED